ncbi:hypothetical protein B0T25DRAFT_536667 [Lasiosphaeria hispida]|uniref:Heterokaryon incompatibility domain-containing protein n=1 Tax=Lasiosphaeria hispida TaxID=260671 RepID=A0AAJ0HKA3_9PEZI|nr:hypothetical protein B0T25DRAFT_536667 [Lasiosphaeria hispida]
MFKWYRNAGICYAYLEDVADIPAPASSPATTTQEETDMDNIMPLDPDPHFTSKFSSSRWFTRGWTLQELLTP